MAIMQSKLPTKVLIIAVIKKGETILLRKKPEGAPPYKETWYLFGAELEPGVSLEDSLNKLLQHQTGIQIRVVEQASWDTEVKNDLDDVLKQFVYLDVICEYVSGELTPGPGIERLEWASVDRLSEYDLVPPSRILFKKLGYLA